MLYFLFFILSCISFAKDTDTQTNQAHSQVRLVSEHKVFYAGETYYLGLEITPDPGWHTLWVKSGNSTSAPVFKFKPLPGVEFGKAHYPIPSRFKVGPIYSIGYSDKVLIQFPVKIASNSDLRRLDIELNAQWLACHEECIPGFYKFKMNLPSPPPMPVKSDHEKQLLLKASLNQNYASDFKQGRKDWPQKNTHPSFNKQQKHLDLKLDSQLNVVDIFPYPNLDISNQPPKLLKDASQKIYRFKRVKKDTASKDFYKFLVVYKNKKNQLNSFIVQTKPTSKFALILIFGFLGGVILSLMLCGFSLLLLKLFQVLKLKKTHKAFKTYLFYSLGGMASFLIFVLVMTALPTSSASFIKAARGYVLSYSTVEVLAVFVSLGLGLSCPFLVSAIFKQNDKATLDS